MLQAMRCYFVVVHGRLKWRAAPAEIGTSEGYRPRGFYCHRFVLAPDPERAALKSFRRVRKNLDHLTAWLKDGSASLELEVHHVRIAPFHMLLKRENRGHTFYEED